MKILVIGRTFPEKETGMLGIFEYEQALALKKTGQEVMYYFCDTRSVFRLHKVGRFISNSTIAIEGMHLPVGRLPYVLFERIKTYFSLKMLKRILSEYKPDVVHIHFPIIVMTEKVWKYIRDHCGCVVVTEHFTKVMSKQIGERQQKLLKQIVNQADTFLCVSDALKKSVQELTNTEQDIHVIPNMLDRRFEYVERECTDKVCFVFSGRIAKVKRVDLIIRAFARGFHNNNKYELHVIGDGPELNKCKKLASKLGIDAQVFFHGFVSREEVCRQMQKSDFFITASKIETFCVPVIEAWFCGIPTVLPDNIPLESYTSEFNSIIYRSGDENSLMQAMIDVVENKSRFDAQRISTVAVEAFSSENIANTLVNLYKRQIGKVEQQ